MQIGEINQQVSLKLDDCCQNKLRSLISDIILVNTEKKVYGVKDFGLKILKND